MAAQTLRPKLTKGVILVEAACVPQPYTTPTEIGITGNDHMMMMDSNSKQIAEFMMKWNDQHASERTGRSHGHAGH